MRSAAPRWSFLALVALVAVPALAEASPRSRGRRGPGGAVAAGPAFADDALQAVVRNTPAGGTAFLPRGTFRGNLVLDRSMTLVASPAGTTIDATGLGLPAIRLLSGVTDVQIQGVRLQGAGGDGVLAEGGNHRLQLRAVTVVGVAGDAAHLVEAADVVADRCRFEGNAGDGLDASGPRLRATRLLLLRNAGAGVVVRGREGLVSDSTFEGGAEGVRLEGERDVVRRNAFRGVGVAARLAAASDTCTFERNDVRGGASALVADPGSIYGAATANRVDGLSADAFALAGSWHTVASNVITRVAGSAVDGDGSSLRVQGNDISDTGDAGVALRGPGNMVDGNVTRRTQGPAIALLGDGNVVALNAATDGGDGILLDGAMNRAVSNRVEGARGEGIVLTGDGNTLQGNVLRGAAGNGIRVASGAANYLVANSIVGCGDRGLSDGGSGTVLERNRIE